MTQTVLLVPLPRKKLLKYNPIRSLHAGGLASLFLHNL